MIRVGFLTHNTRADNGWGRTSRELISVLSVQGVVGTVLVEEAGGIEGEKRALWRSQAHPVYLFLGVLRALPRLYACDVIHAFDGYPYAIIGAFAAKLFGKKFVVTLHGTYALDPFYNTRRPYIKGLYLWALKRADAVVGVSSYTLQAVREFAKFESRGVISNGTSLFWLKAPRTAAPAENIKKPYILSVGMVKPQKGFTTSLRAFAKAKRQFPDLSYGIIGNQTGRHFSEIVRLADELGVRNAVYFSQDVSDDELLAFYDHAELFVLTPVRIGQYIEGFGMVYRAAGARGLAGIGSKNCGAEDAVQDGVSGILCPQGDEDAVAFAMTRLLKDVALRARMGEAGRELSRRDTWESVARKYYTLYENPIPR